MTVPADGVLFIHAFPMDARMWDGQVAALDGSWPTVAPSLPGFGGSDDAGPTMTMGAAADRCLRAADEIGLERMVVCGLSMGGYVAFELWRMARQRVAGIVLANTRSGADAREAADGRRALADRLESEGNGFMVEAPPPLLSSDAPPAMWAQVRETIAEQPAPSIAAAARGMAQRKDSTPDLSAIDVPVLIVTSDADTLIAPEVSLAMAEHIPGAQQVTLAGGGHLSNLEVPEAFDEALRAFLEGFQRI
ncbi:MAG TPA: alpha/beta fold hydrolase [Actinomycetota bacterium]